MEQEEQLDAQSVSGLKFQLKKEQKMAVKSMLMCQDVLAVLATGYGQGLYSKLACWQESN